MQRYKDKRSFWTRIAQLFDRDILQRIMKEGRQLLQSVDIIFLEGVHFHHITDYFLAISKNISLLNFLNANRTHKTYLLEQIADEASIFRVEEQGREALIRQKRNDKSNEAFYWLDASANENSESRQDYHFRIKVKSELEIVKEQKNRSIIRVTIQRFLSTEQQCFSDLVRMGSKSYLFKPNYCSFGKLNEIVYPKARILRMTECKKKELILVLNQTNLRELPFFVAAVTQMSKEHRITKIIGHPSSLFLCFLIDPQGNISQKMQQTILNYKSIPRRKSKPLQKITKAEIVKSIMFKFLAQQNILNQSLAQFLVDNIVNDQFIADFTAIIRLYYRIFLKEDISKGEIDLAIDQYFYFEEQIIQKYAFSFTSLLTLIEFRHNLQCNGLISSLLADLGKIENITLEDLYKFNRVEFTFIGLDLTDKTVRFFNHKTTPKLPIIVIFSLVQFLPAPYKSFIWREEWGRYHIQYESVVKEVNINMHEIVDSRFLLECPMDLIGDSTLRRCYMTESSQTAVIHALSSARRKVDQLQEIGELKALLKSMKSNAIDSIPKFRLIWKILTTKNKIDLDLNNLETFRQIPLLGRVIQLDETYKCYLQNVNKQANNDRIFKDTAHFLFSNKLSIQSMCKNLQKVQSLLSDYIKNETYSERSQQQFAEQVESLQKQVNRQKLFHYEEYLFLISKIKMLIKTYHLQSKYKYKMQIETIVEKINSFTDFVDQEMISQAIKQIVNLLKMAKLKTKKDAFEFDPLSSGYLRDTFSFLNAAQKVSQNLVSLLQQFKRQNRAFKDELTSTKTDYAFVKYEKIMFRVFQKWQKQIQKGSNNKKAKHFYREIFKITPYLYLAEERARHQVIQYQLIKNMLNEYGEKHKIHLVLNGQPRTLLEVGQKLITIKNCQTNSKISSITSTNHHSIAAFLFSLGLDDETFLEQLVGLEDLVTININNPNDDSLDLVELLLHQQQGQGQNEQSHQLYLKIAKKYQVAFKLLIQLQSQWNKKIHKLYLLIDQYDRQQQDVPNEIKQKEIVSFLQTLIEHQKQRAKKVTLVLQNKQMIEEKLKLNKIGIKFMIRFLYRNPQKQQNWFNIHTQRYKLLLTYEAYLKELFVKYNLSQNITLQEFNDTNHVHIKLSFLLVNYKQNRFELFDSKKGSIKLIELLLAALSVPVDFAPKNIDIREKDNQEIIAFVLGKSAQKFTHHFKEQLYWSCYGINSSPFNILQKESDPDTLFVSFQFVYRTYEQVTERQRPNRESFKQPDEKNNLRMIDLLSMWWTKSKKLTPEMKEILFGSIFQSPFLAFYSLIQNSSYEDLFAARQRRNVINLDEEGHELLTKGRVIGQYFNKQECIALKIARQGSKIVMEVIGIRSNIEVQLQQLVQYMREGQTYSLKQEKIRLTIYNFTPKNIEEYQVSFQLQTNHSNHYFKVDIINQQPSISAYSLSNQSTPIKCESYLTLYNIQSDQSVTQLQLNSQVSTCSTGNDAKKLKRGNLNLFLLTHQSRTDQYKQFKCKMIEQVRQSIVISNHNPQPKQNLLCCCFGRPSNEEQQA